MHLFVFQHFYPFQTPDAIDNNVLEVEPKIKMIQRLTRNFLPGRKAKITLIFHASKPLSVRWYYHDRGVSKSLDGSEVPGRMPLDGEQLFLANALGNVDVT